MAKKHRLQNPISSLLKNHFVATSYCIYTVIVLSLAFSKFLNNSKIRWNWKKMENCDPLASCQTNKSKARANTTAAKTQFIQNEGHNHVIAGGSRHVIVDCCRRQLSHDAFFMNLNFNYKYCVNCKHLSINMHPAEPSFASKCLKALSFQAELLFWPWKVRKTAIVIDWREH